MRGSTARRFVRSNVLGLIAFFVAVSGTTAAVGQTDGGSQATRAAVTAKKFKKLKQRVKALEKLIATPASGDLAGTFPNLQIGAGTVGTNELANNAVNDAKIADNAVSTAKIADNAVSTAKIANDAVDSLKIGANAVGSAEIANNTVGANELKALNYRTTSATTVNAGTVELVNSGSTCLGGEEEFSWGGFWSNLADENLSLQGSLWFGDWLVYAGNASGTNRTFTGMASCLTP